MFNFAQRFWPQWFRRRTYLTPAQIVDDVAKKTARGVDWKSFKKSQLIGLHFTLGMQIRNDYDLWDPEYPYLEGKHPDDVSMAIIKKVWERAQ